MDDLTAFLNARLDEDEAAAMKAARVARADWKARSDIAGRWVRSVIPASGAVAETFDAEDVVAPYIARHDPARALRDVAGKRRILAAYTEVAYMDIADPEPEYAYGRAAGLGEAVRQIAAAWNDHSDYKPGWAPEGASDGT